jgi:hypothetical protein
MTKDAVEQRASTLSCNSRRACALLCDATSGKPSTRSPADLISSADTSCQPHYLLPAWPLSTDTIHHLASALWYRETSLVKSPSVVNFRILPYLLSTLSWFILRLFHNPVTSNIAIIDLFEMMWKEVSFAGYRLDDRGVGVRVPIK